MSDCIKKGQAGLGSGGWAEQTAGVYHPSLSRSFLPSLDVSLARPLLWHVATVRLLHFKASAHV